MSNKHFNKKLILAGSGVLAIMIVAVMMRSTALTVSSSDVVVATTKERAAFPKDIKIESMHSSTSNMMAISEKIKNSTHLKTTDAISDALVAAGQLDKKNQFEKARTNKDKYGNTHERYQQTYEGIPVWGGNVIVHSGQNGQIKKVTGKQIDGLETKLAGTDLKKPTISVEQALNLAKQKAGEFINNASVGDFSFRNEKSNLFIYVDGNDKAYQAYHVDYVVEAPQGIARPNVMIDAQTGSVLKQWNSLMADEVGTGPGGNVKIGQHEFGTTPNFGYLDVTPDALNINCTMTDQSNYVSSVNLKQGTFQYAPWVYPCFRNIDRAANGGYSPLNDAHFYGKKTVDMYKNWAGTLPTFNDSDSDSDSDSKITVDDSGLVVGNGDITEISRSKISLTEKWTLTAIDATTFGVVGSVSGAKASATVGEAYDNGILAFKINSGTTPFAEGDTFLISYETKPILLRTSYGFSYENAHWDGSYISFGDGDDYFYPLSTAADIVSHEIAHAFTNSNSNLIYEKQSGAINEAYSDVAGEALEYYWKGTNDWKVAADTVKGDGALRYMQNPKLDNYSITHTAQYNDALDVHSSSGVFNRAAYLIANLSGPDAWDTQKVFEIFTAANQNYWTESSTFVSASCDVLSATVDAGYDPDPVRKAFQSVGVFCNDASITLDEDSDGMNDRWENNNGLDANIDDADADADEDGFSNLKEYKAGSDPKNIKSVPIETLFGESFESAQLPTGWTTTFGSDKPWIPQRNAKLSTDLYYSLVAKPAPGQYAQIEISANFVEGTKFRFDQLVQIGEMDLSEVYVDGEFRASSGYLDEWQQDVSITMTGGWHTILFQFIRDEKSLNYAKSPKKVYMDNIRFTHLEADTDGDGVGNSMDADDDGDGVSDAIEQKQGTNSLVIDTDGDGFVDGVDSYPLDDTRFGIRGALTGANMGNAVAVADVNGDGYGDIVVGSFKEDPVNQTTGARMNDAGTVRVYSGADGMLLYRWLGEASGDNFGVSVANAGDVNNDGKDDVIIGATGFDPIVSSGKLSNAGAAYVYSGTGTFGTKLRRFEGAAAGDNFGVAVAGGDIDGDTNNDLIVGANLADPLDIAGKKMSNAGRVYAYSGNGFAQLNRWDGQATGDAFGSAVAMGDVNDDAMDDIIVGAPKRDMGGAITLKDAGVIYAYSGNGFAELTPLNGQAAGDEFGSSLAVGAIDAVAGMDIVVGAPKQDLGTLKDVGAVYAYSGVSYAPITALSKIGGAAGDAFGTALAVGSIDAVAGDDLVVGICKSDYTDPAIKVFKDAGSVNVYSGVTGASLVTVSPLTGTTSGQGFGCAVATGDTNNDNDSIADVVVGSPKADSTGATDAGSVNIYLGNSL